MTHSLDRTVIASLIPHAGAMCLLDRVLHWDIDSIECLSLSYKKPTNPLRRPDGRLGSACGIELAAQAMALHGRLVEHDSARPTSHGYLASLREVRLHRRFLDNLDDRLRINVRRLMGDSRSATYYFELKCQNEHLLTGRATVVLAAEER